RQSQWRYLRNPLVPHATRPGVYIEGDFLVLANDTLCVVEVKNLVGRLFFEDAEQRVVRQEKLGRYGDVMSSKQFPNPFPKVNSFARRLKDHLAGLDASGASTWMPSRSFPQQPTSLASTLQRD